MGGLVTVGEEPEHSSNDDPTMTVPLDSGMGSGQVPPEVSCLYWLIKQVDDTIEETCQKTLEPKCAPNPRGTRWWNEECSAAHTIARSTNSSQEKKMAAVGLRKVIQKAKQDWVHVKLHEAVDTEDIWAMASHRKGRCTNIFLVLRNDNNTLTNKPTDKVDLSRLSTTPVSGCS